MKRPALSYFERAVWYLPALALLTVILIYPVIRTISLSFFHNSLATGFRSEFAGLDNFYRAFGDSRFLSSIRITFLFTLVSVALELIIGLLLALSLKSVKRWRNTIRVIFLIPWTLPTAVIAVLWAWILNDQYGALNAVLVRFGLLDTPVTWLGSPWSAMLAIIAADIWKTTPFVFLVLLAGLQNIPQDLYEAIEIDGGGVWAKFRYVTWPHLLPFVFVGLIFRIVQAFAVFDLVWVMTGGGPGGATETVSIYTYRTYMRYLDFGYGAGLVVITVAILTLLAAALYRLLVVRHENTF